MFANGMYLVVQVFSFFVFLEEEGFILGIYVFKESIIEG
jgi:hypothetical protein